MVDGGTDWQKAYEDEHTPWDLRGVSGPLQRIARDGFFDRLHLPPAARIAVPGCGRGHDIQVFAKLGHAVTAFDISPAAIAEAESLLALNRIEGTVLVRDALGVATEFPGEFDLVYDYASFCSLPPHLRTLYCREMAEILKPRGWLLVLGFPMQREMAGPEGRPPYLVTENDLKRAVARDFLLLESFPPEDSAVERRGAEHWYLFRKSVR